MQATTFSELRRKVHAQCLIDLGKRLMHSSLKPTLREIGIGSFLEDLEIQVREAVLEMNRKGYCTWSSGFYGKKSEKQGIDGPFVLDQQTRVKLEKAGAIVKKDKFWSRNYTSIIFHPIVPNTRLIKISWMKLVSLIPSKGYRAIFPETYGSVMFTEHFVPYKKSETLRLRRLIRSKRNSRWIKQWKRQLRKL